MNQSYPVPPPELVGQWCHEDGDEIKTSPRWFQSVCAKAAQWGADQELEALLAWLRCEDYLSLASQLRAARRPKPPSRKEQALEAISRLCASVIHDDLKNDAAIVRRALEQLDD